MDSGLAAREPRQFHHVGKSCTVTIAGQPSEELPAGTLKNIMKQPGIEK
jgi:predicted RNA binding protein YcfA (HicA-like mRNA interferase family)